MTIMRVAIYARYSTDRQDQTSIDGQYRNCEELAQRSNYDVVARFCDKGISGTDDNRPGFQALLKACECGEFEGILVDETSRLTRNPSVLIKLMDDLAFRNQFLRDCKGFDSQHESAALLAGIYGGLDRLELQKIRHRTHRGLRERHIGGFSTGGKTYGYQSERTEDGRWQRVIEPTQARIVREIFKLYADGLSPKRIASELNRRGIPSPGSFWKRTKRRTSGWMHTALVGTAAQGTGILRNEMYVGRVIWNKRRSKRVPGSSRRVFELRPESEWIERHAPELAIINDKLWMSVQKRLRRSRANSKAHNKHPKSRGRQSRYLLSGLLKCSSCGSNFIMENKRAYVCSTHTNGGGHACNNKLRVRRDIAESRLLRGIKDRLVSETVFRHVRKRIASELRRIQRQSAESNGAAYRIRDRLQVIETELAHVTDAIASFRMSAALRKKLGSLEREKVQLTQSLNETSMYCSRLPEILPGLRKRFEEMVASMEDLYARPGVTTDVIAQVRRRVHELLGDVQLVPSDDRTHLIAHVGIRASRLIPAQSLVYKSEENGSGGRI